MDGQVGILTKLVSFSIISFHVLLFGWNTYRNSAIGIITIVTILRLDSTICFDFSVNQFESWKSYELYDHMFLFTI